MLQIYDSKTQKKRPFQPIEPSVVRMYVCGVTVYDYSHVGHARTVIAFDVVARYLQSLGYDVRWVRNITDIDDKIIARAAETKQSWQDLTRTFIRYMKEDFAALGVLEPTVEPQATAFMPHIIAMITRLIEVDAAYQAGNGDVFYRVASKADYGALAHQSLDSLQVGQRVETNQAKESPLDFVLWKHAKPGEPSWDSPWGPGRPGWHIECSAMATHCLGETLDIHGGGHDLCFPHHENERAQSESATGATFVNTWMHAGFVQINAQKMSKSLGNFFTIRDVLKTVDAEVLRYFLMSAHYRSPLDYSDEALSLAQSALSRFYLALRDVELADDVDSVWQSRFREAMDDDFNTPAALAVLFDLVKALNKAKTQKSNQAPVLAATLVRLGGVLGLLQRPAEEFLQSVAGEQVVQVEALIQERNLARLEQDWSRADSLRAQLGDLGVLLEDKPNGETFWRKK